MPQKPKAGQCRLNDVQRALVEKNLGLITLTIRKYRLWDAVLGEEIWQIGALGLMRAALSFDPSKASFATFAVRCIESEIRMERRRRLATKRGCGFRTISMDAPVGMDDGTWSNTLRDLLPAVQASVEDEVIRGLAAREVLALLQQMDGRQAVIARGYFLDEKPQQVLARELGLSQSMVSREVKRALEQLRATFPYGGDVL